MVSQSRGRWVVGALVSSDDLRYIFYSKERGVWVTDGPELEIPSLEEAKKAIEDDAGRKIEWKVDEYCADFGDLVGRVERTADYWCWEVYGLVCGEPLVEMEVAGVASTPEEGQTRAEEVVDVLTCTYQELERRFRSMKVKSE